MKSRRWLRYVPRYSLRMYFLFVFVLGAMAAAWAWSSAAASRAERLNERARYASAAITAITGHEAVFTNPIFEKYDLQVSNATGGGTSHGPPVVIDVDGFFVVTSYHQAELNWPVEEIEQAILSSLAQAMEELQIVSAGHVTVSDGKVELTGDEGSVIWEVDNVEYRNMPHLPPVPEITFVAHGHLQFDKPADHPLKLYKLGFEPEKALLSDDPAERRAGARRMRIYDGTDKIVAIQRAIGRETDASVLDVLFEQLQMKGYSTPGDLRPTLVRFLTPLLADPGPQGRLAARTLLRSDATYDYFEAVNLGPWPPTASANFRQAAIDSLYNGEADDWLWAIRALQHIGAQGDPDVIDALYAALLSGGPQRGFYVVNALASQTSAYDRAFTILAQSDQTEVWYRAGKILTSQWSVAHAAAPRDLRQRVENLTGIPRLRIELVRNSPAERREQLEALGDEAVDFLAPYATYETYALEPELYYHAIEWLKESGELRAAAVVARAIEDFNRWGQLSEFSSQQPPIDTLRAINELTGESFGQPQLGEYLRSDDPRKSLDWAPILTELAERFGESR